MHAHQCSIQTSRLIKLGIYGFCSGQEMARRRGWCHLPKQCGAMMFFCSVAHSPHILPPMYVYHSNVPPSLALLNLMLPLFSLQFSVATYGTWNFFFFLLAFCIFWAIAELLHFLVYLFTSFC